MRNTSMIAMLLTLCLTAPLAMGKKPFSGKWEIESRNRAESAGTISFAISFEPGKDGATLESLSADVEVPANSHENKVAKLIETSLSETLEEKGFKVTRNDGEKVVIKAKGDAPDFELKLIGNTVQGISLSLDD